VISFFAAIFMGHEIAKQTFPLVFLPSSFADSMSLFAKSLEICAKKRVKKKWNESNS
jgi:hypothetical protein